jgi:hypothetical protein
LFHAFQKTKKKKLLLCLLSVGRRYWTGRSKNLTNLIFVLFPSVYIFYLDLLLSLQNVWTLSHVARIYPRDIVRSCVLPKNQNFLIF